jgi:hypothetical protein
VPSAWHASDLLGGSYSTLSAHYTTVSVTVEPAGCRALGALNRDLRRAIKKIQFHVVYYNSVYGGQEIWRLKKIGIQPGSFRDYAQLMNEDASISNAMLQKSLATAVAGLPNVVAVELIQHNGGKTLG